MDIEELQRKVIEFRDARDWAKYHNPKDLTISLSLEVAADHKPVFGDENEDIGLGNAYCCNLNAE